MGQLLSRRRINEPANVSEGVLRKQPVRHLRGALGAQFCVFFSAARPLSFLARRRSAWRNVTGFRDLRCPRLVGFSPRLIPSGLNRELSRDCGTNTKASGLLSEHVQQTTTITDLLVQSGLRAQQNIGPVFRGWPGTPCSVNNSGRTAPRHPA